MTELITAAELGELFKRSIAVIEAKLKEHKVAGHRIKYGDGHMLVFDKKAAMDVLTPAFAEAPGRPGDAALLEHLKRVETLAKASSNALESLLGASHENEARTDTLLAGLAKLADQNVLLLRAVDNTRIDLLAQVKALQESIDAMAERPATVCLAEASRPSVVVPPATKPPRHNPEPLTAEKPVKPRVAVVGLLNAQQNVIEKEFGDAFDLRFFTSDAARGRAFMEAISNCKPVLLMINFANHGIEDAVRAAGPNLVRVNGGMSSLRDKLTELFVKLGEGVTA